MKKYYIIRAEGSSIFEQSYPEDFIFHCLINLLDSSDEQYRLLWFANADKLTAVQADRGTGDMSPVLALTEPEYT